MALCIILAFSAFFVSHAEAEGGVSSEFTTVTNGIFTFEIPVTWRKMTNRELHVFKRQYEQQSTELFKQYHGHSEGYESGVPLIVGFFSQNRKLHWCCLL